ncbi:MAG: class I SAM-dependent methyltransferase, partial [Pyrinomonadaceae bacterium]
QHRASEWSSQSKDRETPALAAVADLDPLLASLADSLRGTEEDVKRELRAYVPLLRESGIFADILDLGCGRGEWLGLLKEEGLHAYGVETNLLLIQRAREQGLNVVEADALAHLRSLPAESLQAVTAFHLMEHLHFEQLVQLLLEVKRTLKPGGLVVLETPNPKNLVVAACNFYADPTHHKPLFPETLKSVFDYVGFVNITVEFLHPVDDSPFDAKTPQSEALKTWLFGPCDFAIVARKDPTSSTGQL